MTLLSLVGQMSQGIEDKVSKLISVGHMTNYICVLLYNYDHLMQLKALEEKAKI